MTTQRPVLVATGFSDAADEAMRQGHAEALHRRTRLVVCHVLPESFRVRVLFPHESRIDLPAQAALEGLARDLLRARLDAVLGHATVPIALDVEAGSPHAGILDAADRVNAALIVTGPGPAAERVARAALCPVLVARPSPARGPVIGATDFSSAALPALSGAAAAAAATGNPLVVMHCLELAPSAAAAAASAGGVVPLPFVPEEVGRDMTAEAIRRLSDALDTFGVVGRALVLPAPPNRGIVESAVAEGASRVVVGTHGRAGVSRMLMGSVAEYVASHAPCSVMIVPLPRPEPAPEARATSTGGGHVPGLAVIMARLLAAVTVVAAMAQPASSVAQEPATHRAATSLAEMMEQANLDCFATREAADGDVYLSVMYVKGVQLLAVRARHPVPAALDARIAAGDFRGAYADHNGSTIREGKLFVMDMGADGLVPRPEKGKAFDIAYEDGERETRFDGEWRRQHLSEEEYRRRVGDIEHRYSAILNALMAALRRLGP